MFVTSNPTKTSDGDVEADADAKVTTKAPPELLYMPACKLQQNLNGLNPDGSFALPDYFSFMGPYDPIYETFVVKFLHLCFHAVISFSMTGGH